MRMLRNFDFYFRKSLQQIELTRQAINENNLMKLPFIWPVNFSIRNECWCLCSITMAACQQNSYINNNTLTVDNYWGSGTCTAWYPPNASWYLFTVLSIPHSTHNIPTVLIIFPRYSWYPPHSSWYPQRYWISSTVFKIFPQGSHDISPRYWTTSTVLSTPPPPHATEQTLYRVRMR